jgi:flagellar hook assembly protein FlgD
MKKLYTLLFLLFSVAFAQAQCTIELLIDANGNEVTATIIGEGATVPFYTIDWGDGNFEFPTNGISSHNYAVAGEYTITAVYLDQAPPNCSQSIQQIVIITGGGCALNFTPVVFGMTATVFVSSEDTSAPSYTIDWGDGSPLIYGDQGTHAYQTPGEYQICVSLIDQDNPDFCNLYECQSVTVQEQSGDCTVDLTVTVDETTVSAVAVGSGATTPNYVISWGDESISQGDISAHTYLVSGEYEVCVYYGDLMPGGCLASACETVIAEAGGGSDCTLEISVNAAGLIAVVTADGVGAESPEYTFDWGDGSPPTSDVPAVHTYSAPATYLVCVSYIDLNNLAGCQVNQCQEITIEEVSSDCTLDIAVTTNGSTVNVDATGVGATVPQYAITWGVASAPTLSNSGSYTYTTGGAFEVCVTYTDITNLAGCLVTECETVNITVGVDEMIQSLSSLRVSPNPLSAQSFVDLTLGTAADIQVNVYDITGSLISNIANGTRGQGDHRFIWNTHELASGIYFIRVEANEDLKTIKAVK